MIDKYCTNCGQERADVAKFCGNCGYAFESQVHLETAAALTESEPMTMPHVQVSSLPKSGIMYKILLNGVLSILLVMSYARLERYIDWGGDDKSNLLFFLVLTLIAQFFAMRRGSFFALIPMVISFILGIKTYTLYEGFKYWLRFEGFQTQEAVGGDTAFLIVYMLCFFGMAFCSFISLFFRKG